MKHILENIYPSYRPTLWDRLMTSTSLSSSELRERKTLQEVMTISNPILLGMLLVACGGGGGGSPAPKSAPEIPLELEITPTGKSPIKSDDAAGLLPEKSNGVLDGAIALGTINDNKNDNGEAVYALNDDTADIDNGDFTILNNVLSYIGYDSGYFGADGSKKAYMIDILRFDDKEHYDSFIADPENAKQPLAVTYIIHLQNKLTLPPAENSAEGVGLYLSTSIDGEALNIYTRGDGTRTNPPDGKEARDFDTIDLALLGENVSGSGTAIELGTVAHDDYVPGLVADADDGAGDGDDISIAYRYTLSGSTDAKYSNALFRIDDNDELVFIGADSGDYATSPTIDVQIDVTLSVTIALADDFAGRINADASGDAGDADTREFAFDGGAISSSNEVGGLKLTAVAGGVAANGFKVVFVTLASGGEVSVAITGTTITISVVLTSTFSNIKSTLDGAIDGGVLDGVVTLDTTSDYNAVSRVSGSTEFGGRFDIVSGSSNSSFRTLFLGGIKFTAKLDSTNQGGLYFQLDESLSAVAVSQTLFVTFFNVFHQADTKLSEVVTKLSANSTFTNFYDIDTTGADYNPDALVADITQGKYDFVGDLDNAYRSVDVAAGEIYAPDIDGRTGKIIKFDAVIGLRVGEDSYVIVTDADGDGVGVVSAVAALPTDGSDFYVLGQVAAAEVAVAAVAASLTEGTTNSATFTADTAGANGDNLDITFTASSTAGTAVTVAFTGSSTEDITITYDISAALSHLETAFASGTLAANIALLYDLAIGGADTTLLSTIFTDGTQSLSGGADATTRVTGGAPTLNMTGQTQDGPYQWVSDQLIDTEDFTINIGPDIL